MSCWEEGNLTGQSALLSRFSHVQLFLTLWTIALQAPLSMGFSRQENWSGLPCPPPGDLPDSGTEPKSPASSALQAGSLLRRTHKVLSWWVDWGGHIFWKLRSPRQDRKATLWIKRRRWTEALLSSLTTALLSSSQKIPRDPWKPSKKAPPWSVSHPHYILPGFLERASCWASLSLSLSSPLSIFYSVATLFFLKHIWLYYLF